MLDHFFYRKFSVARTTYPVLTRKIKMAENLFLYIHALLVGY